MDWLLSLDNLKWTEVHTATKNMSSFDVGCATRTFNWILGEKLATIYMNSGQKIKSIAHSKIR